MKLVIISCDDWEAMYLGEDCIYQGHGMERYDFVKFLEEHKLNHSDVFMFDAEEEDDSYAYKTGRLPNKFSELKGIYDI